MGNTCQKITCRTGQQLVGNTCQKITCRTGQQLVGNTCQKITCRTGQQLVGNTCQRITCPSGQELVGNTCQRITCGAAERLMGNTCKKTTHYHSGFRTSASFQSYRSIRDIVAIKTPSITQARVGQKVYYYVSFRNVRPGAQLVVKFYTPKGRLGFKHDSDAFKAGPSKEFVTFFWRFRMNIPGRWQLRYYLDGVLLKTTPFVIQ